MENQSTLDCGIQQVGSIKCSSTSKYIHVSACACACACSSGLMSHDLALGMVQARADSSLPFFITMAFVFSARPLSVVVSSLVSGDTM